MTTHTARVQDAVKNDEWQKFRLSMKGKPTPEKIRMLEQYYDAQVDQLERDAFKYKMSDTVVDDELEVIKLRIDNYIKALCRGGQLDAGMTFDHFNDGSIRNHIRK